MERDHMVMTITIFFSSNFDLNSTYYFCKAPTASKNGADFVEEDFGAGHLGAEFPSARHSIAGTNGCRIIVPGLPFQRDNFSS